jgi:hypothetical protein
LKPLSLTDPHIVCPKLICSKGLLKNGEIQTVKYWKFYYESTGQKYSTFGIDIAISVA